MTRKLGFFVLLLLVVFASARKDQLSLAHAAGHGDSLIVYLYATDVRFSKNGPSDQLTYRVHANFPAVAVIDWISQRLHEAGWKPLNNDFLNPNLPASQMRSWHEHLAAADRLDTCVRQWIGDWRNPSADIVRYAFRYEEPSGCQGPCSSHASTNLEVFAYYFPKDAVQKIMKAFEQGKR